MSRRSEGCHQRTVRSSRVCVSGSGGGGVRVMCCRKISEMMLNDGVPTARPSVSVTVMSLCRKWFCCVIVSYQSRSSDFILVCVVEV